MLFGCVQDRIPNFTRYVESHFFELVYLIVLLGSVNERGFQLIALQIKPDLGFGVHAYGSAVSALQHLHGIFGYLEHRSIMLANR